MSLSLQSLATPAPRAIPRLQGVATTVASAALVLLTLATAILFLPTVTLGAVVRLAIPCLLHLGLLVAGPWYMERTRARAVPLLYFGLQLGVVVLLLYVGGRSLSLVPLALVSQAVLYLDRRLAAVVTLAVVVAVSWTGWEGTLLVASWLRSIFGYVAGIAFVIVFSAVALRQHEERCRADELAVALTAANERLRGYTAEAAVRAAAEERNRVARDVHDGLGHHLTVAHVQVEAARTLLRRDPDRAEQALVRARDTIHTGLAEVRRSVGILRGPGPETGPLRAALETWAGELRDEGYAVELAVTGGEGALPPAIEYVLYRSAQEAITNIRRHARARRVRIELAASPAAVSLRLEDDGVGAPASTPEAAAFTGADNPGFGLRGVSERAAALGGRAAVESVPGGGFALSVEVPLAPAGATL